VDYGLISQKGKGLTAKSVGIFQHGIFFNGKIRWTVSTIRGPWVAPVHGGPRMGPRWWLTGAQPSSRSRPWRLTVSGAAERGLHGESISGLTGASTAAWRPGDDSEEAAVVALGWGGARAWRAEKESGETCCEDRAGHRPFIGGRRETGANASWPASMPQLEGAGYRSQAGEGV
jgi:hypothetical protein